MAYSKKIQDEAFALYCQGLSDEKIVEGMKKHRRRGFKLTRKSVAEWREKLSWENRRNLIWQNSRLKQDGDIVKNLNDVCQRLSHMVEYLADELPKANPSSETAIANTIRGLLRDLVKYQGLSEDSKTSAVQIASMIFGIIQEDEEGADYLARKQAWILEQLEHRMREEV